MVLVPSAHATDVPELNPNTSPSPESSPERRPIVLTPLTSIRFLAALQLFLFHILAFHRSPGPENKFPAFDTMPPPVLNLIDRGFCSTSLFFLLSGFILTYLYVDRLGVATSDRVNFWIARLSRIYPLHLLLLVLLAVPIIQFSKMFGATTFDVAAGGALCAALVQAWFPKYALAWNFPTWALSVVAFFYLVFPSAVCWLQPLPRRSLGILLVVLPVVSVIPSIIYVVLTAGATPAPFDFWQELMMRNPLLWLPHFLMGMTLARYFGISRSGGDWRDSVRRRWLSWGDGCFVALLVIEMFVTEIPAGWLGEDAVPIHGFLLRHGPLAPLYYVIIYDLAVQRGVLARLLALPGMKILGDASFSIFMLQLPGLIVFPSIAAAMGLSPAMQLTLVVVGTLVASVLSTNLFEKPVSRWLRRRFETHGRHRADGSLRTAAALQSRIQADPSRRDHSH